MISQIRKDGFSVMQKKISKTADSTFSDSAFHGVWSRNRKKPGSDICFNTNVSNNMKRRQTMSHNGDFIRNITRLHNDDV